MWEIIDHSPFRTACCFARDRQGIENYVIAVRAKFDVRDDGLLSISEHQEDVRLQAQYRDFASTEFVAESDIAPFRPRPDILLAGIAIPLGGAVATSCRLTLRVGKLRKTAVVIGERRLKKRRTGFVVEGPENFLGVRLTWRASLGGKDPLSKEDEEAFHPDNPVGRGWTRAWEKLPLSAELNMPLIENDAHRILASAPLPAPHGFSPLPPHWRPRRHYAGTYDHKWEEELAPLPPEDFREEFHQAAPPDQVYDGELRGGEPVEIGGMHEAGPYSFLLPQMLLEATTKIGRDRIVSRFKIVSLLIDGTAKRIDVSWNAAIPCHGRDHQLEYTIVSLKQMSGVAP